MIVKIKINGLIKYELKNTGMIKAQSMISELFKNEHITKKINNVCESIENLLYDGKEVEKAYYDALMNEVELHLKNENMKLTEKTCEYCGGKLFENDQCSQCGIYNEFK